MTKDRYLTLLGALNRQQIGIQPSNIYNLCRQIIDTFSDQINKKGRKLVPPNLIMIGLSKLVYLPYSENNYNNK